MHLALLLLAAIALAIAGCGAAARPPQPGGMPQYPELAGPNVVTFPVSGDFTIRNGRRSVIQGTRKPDGGCAFSHKTPSVFPGDPISAGRVLAHDLDSCLFLVEEGEYVGPPLGTGPRESPIPAAPSSYQVPR